MTVAFGMAILLLAGFLTLASYIERIYAEMGRFLSRDFQENIEAFEQRVEPHLGVSRNRAALSMSVLAQLTTAALGMVIAVATIGNDKSDPQEIAKAAVTLVLIIALCNRLLPFVLFTRTKGLWLVPFVPLLRIFCYLLLIVTIPLGFSQSVAALAEESAPEEPEHP